MSSKFFDINVSTRLNYRDMVNLKSKCSKKLTELNSDISTNTEFCTTDGGFVINFPTEIDQIVFYNFLLFLIGLKEKEYEKGDIAIKKPGQESNTPGNLRSVIEEFIIK